LRDADGVDRENALPQLRILATRARLVRTAIALAAVSVLLVAMLIISIFVGALFQLAVAPAIVTLFIACMVSLIGSLALFLADIDLSLKALWLVMPAEAQRTSAL
jgi:hypothetical protein